MGGAPAGLDYAAVEPTARLMGLAVTPETFGDLRAMERAALAARKSGA